MRKFLVGFLLIWPGLAWGWGRPPANLQKPYIVETSSGFSFRSLEDDHGGFYLIWTHAEAGGQVALWGQHIDSEGRASWAEKGSPLVSGLSAGEAGTDWDAVADSKGGVIVVWADEKTVRNQRIGVDAKPLWPSKNERVHVSTAPVSALTVASDGSGGAYVVWAEKSYPDRTVLMAQHTNALGASLWTPQALRVSLRPSDQHRPYAVQDGVAGVIVAWLDFREKTSQLQVQRLNYQGNRLWGLEGLLVTAPAGDPKKPPYMGTVGGGSAVLAWQASSSGADRVFVQRADATGKLDWGPQGAELTLGNWNEWNPILYGDGQGGTWVAWEDFRNNQHWVAYVTHLRVDGKSDWPGGNVALTTIPGTDQGRIGITDDGHGGILAAWVDNRYGTVGVYLQEISGRGERLRGSEGLPLADHLINPRAPKIVSLGHGRIAVAWADTPSKGSWALYWQRVATPPK